MTRRSWLMLTWGILILVIVDGTHFFNIPPYAVNEYSQTNYESNNEQEGFNGPVLSILIKLVDTIEGVVDRHETLFIVLSTIAIAFFTGTLYRATSGLLAAAEQQKSDMRESLRIANASANAALIQANVLTSSERGYAKMSHCQPLNLEDTAGSVRFKMEIKNWGRTPIQVSGLLLFPHILDANEPLPKDPPYRGNDRRSAHALLVSGENFFFFQYVSAGENYRAVRGGTKILYLIGYVDYTDKFGIKRRGGYARQYDPEERDLVFVSQENYNYDRNRKEGEELPA